MHADDTAWHVLLVAPTREIAFAAADDDTGRLERRVRGALQGLGLIAIVPTELRTRRVVGKQGRPLIITTSAALMPGYVFIGCRSVPDWPSILAIDHVRGYIASDGQPARLSAADVDAMQRLAKATRAPRGTLQVGDTARIRRGPFRGLDAIISAIRPDLIKVALHVFGAQREVAMSVDNVERV